MSEMEMELSPMIAVGAQTSGTTDNVPISNHSRECLESAFEKIKATSPGSGTGTPNALIQRVPQGLCNSKNSEKYFWHPTEVAFGPIHHGNECLEPAEEIKRGLAHAFSKEFLNQEENKLSKHNHPFVEEIEELRRKYDNEVVAKYDDEELAWMLFVDGCALLFFICLSTDEEFEDNQLKTIFTRSTRFWAKDVFFLENQLPYQVLNLIVRSCRKNLENSIKKFIDLNALMRDSTNFAIGNPAHLLDLLRSRFVDPHSGNNGHQTCGRRDNHDIFRVAGCFPGPTSGNGHCINLPCFSDPSSDAPFHFTFRNIKELKAAGITVKPSKSRSLSDISFTRQLCYSGTLKLPPIMVDDFTASKFLNLAAYEMCPDFFNDLVITSYICFMDSLIDQAEDVKELRDAGILHNRLGSDEEVANLFNEISKGLAPRHSMYLPVQKQIQKHYDKKCATWMYQFFHDHFGSPWTISAFIGVIVGLVLSFLQTWTALHPGDDPCSCNKSTQ